MGLKLHFTVDVSDFGIGIEKDGQIVFNSRVPIWERKEPLPVRRRAVRPAPEPKVSENMALSPAMIRALRAYRPQHGRTDVKLLKVWKLRQRGLSHKAIGKRLKCSDVLIGSRLRMIDGLLNSNGNGNGKGHKQVMYASPEDARKVGLVK
jgi:hypothetical protein